MIDEHAAHPPGPSNILNQHFVWKNAFTDVFAGTSAAEFWITSWTTLLTKI